MYQKKKPSRKRRLFFYALRIAATSFLFFQKDIANSLTICNPAIAGLQIVTPKIYYNE